LAAGLKPKPTWAPSGRVSEFTPANPVGAGRDDDPFVVGRVSHDRRALLVQSHRADDHRGMLDRSLRRAERARDLDDQAAAPFGAEVRVSPRRLEPAVSRAADDRLLEPPWMALEPVEDQRAVLLHAVRGERDAAVGENVGQPRVDA
jgi:hypothetical protein